MQCPNCGATAPDEYKFCEECGTGLKAAGNGIAGMRIGISATPAQTCRCGAGAEAKDEQGFCTACGRHWEPAGRDHVELTPAPNFAAISDRGLRHPRNEDDVSLMVHDISGAAAYVIVVCDGVSSSQTPETASAAAATAAEKTLSAAVQSGRKDLAVATAEAIQAAQKAVIEIPYHSGGSKDPPATTIVTAVVADGVAIVGWVGDSRAYWFNGAHCGQLTHDHSWINEVVDSGQMTEEEAMHAPQAHAITQCLGRVEDAPQDYAPESSIISFDLPSPCRLLVCTDGLWNYASAPERIAELVRQAPSESEAVVVCRSLVDYVLAQGARDNVTVALLSL